MRERRRYKRVHINGKCWLEKIDHQKITIFCEIANISEGGVFLKAPTFFSKGDKVNLKMKLPTHNRYFNATGEIVWCQRGLKLKELQIGMGIAFKEIEQEALQAIKSLIEAMGDPATDN